MKERTVFSDFDLNFEPHPLTGDIVPKVNKDAISRALYHLFSIKAFDIPFDPNTDINIRGYLFDNVNRLTVSMLQSRAEWALRKFEPRVSIENVQISPNAAETGINIRISYGINALGIRDDVSFFFQRVR